MISVLEIGSHIQPKASPEEPILLLNRPPRIGCLGKVVRPNMCVKVPAVHEDISATPRGHG